MTEDESWEDVNERVRAEWKTKTTPFERVYEVVEQTPDGQSAATIWTDSKALRIHCERVPENCVNTDGPKRAASSTHD
jgi:hypothetical protein